MFDITQIIVDEGERNEERYEALLDELLPAFAESPEGKGCGHDTQDVGGWVSIFLDYYFGYIGDRISEVSVRDVREVVFELFPRKVSTEPDSAPEIVMELRAFRQFLGRVFTLPQANAIVATLSDDAIVKLKGLLADPRNFGMAKSFVAQGQAAGFDMTTEKGMQEFTAAYNAAIAGRRNLEDPFSATNYLDDLGRLPLVGSYPDFDPERNAAARKEKRKKNKAERKARKRNRR